MGVLKADAVPTTLLSTVIRRYALAQFLDLTTPAFPGQTLLYGLRWDLGGQATPART